MHSTQNAVTNHEYRSVPITALAESATNPRKRFDAKTLEELAASFKTQGILAPLLVRELDESKYEVVAGARRLQSRETGGTRKPPRPRRQTHRCRGYRGAVRGEPATRGHPPTGGSSGFQITLGTRRTCLHRRHHRLTRWQERGVCLRSHSTR